ncbi:MULTISPECIES: hypothetical protein [Bacteria]
MSKTSKRVVLWLFYGGLALLLLLVVSGALDLLAPSIARRVAYNSEAYLFALILGAWIQFGLPRLRPQRLLRWALALASVWALIGVTLAITDLPSRIKTLNEPALALALLIPYVALHRSTRRWMLAAAPALIALTIWAVIWSPDSWIIDQAETIGFVVLAMLTFDVFDRRLLDPGAPSPRAIRWAWYVFMILEPIVVSALGTDIRSEDGPFGLTLTYLGRIHESFVGVLLVALILHLVNDYRRRLAQPS